MVSHVLRTVQLLVLPGFLMIGPLLQREESVWDCCSIAIGSYVFVCSTKSPVVVEICWNHRAPKWRSWRKRTLPQELNCSGWWVESFLLYLEWSRLTPPFTWKFWSGNLQGIGEAQRSFFYSCFVGNSFCLVGMRWTLLCSYMFLPVQKYEIVVSNQSTNALLLVLGILPI